MIDSGRDTAKTKDSHGVISQSHISPSILIFEGKNTAGPSGPALRVGGETGLSPKPHPRYAAVESKHCTCKRVKARTWLLL